MPYIVLVLAKATGWTEEKIINLPFYRVKQYLHSYLVYNGTATRWQHSNAKEKAAIKDKLQRLINNDNNKDPYYTDR